MNMWLRLLVEWYVRKCDEMEGQKRASIILEPRKFELKGPDWCGKQIRVVIETIPALLTPEDSNAWKITNSKLFR